MFTNLTGYGLNDRFIEEAKKSENYPNEVLARIIRQDRDLYKTVTEEGERTAHVSGKFRHEAVDPLDFPAVGDWVLVEPQDESDIIQSVLPRSSVFVRRAAGTSKSVQVVASNIDIVFVCMSLNYDFNLRRLERYLSVANASHAKPIIVLTKFDLCEAEEQSRKRAAAASVGPMVPILMSSDIANVGFEEIGLFIGEGTTAAFLGSSGAGKSTIINRLLNEEVLETGEIRIGDDRGKHTTTFRQLFKLPNGGLVIDTPGMRELSPYVGDVSKTFSDIEELASRCRFPDCSHTAEPGCAIQAAIRSGKLSAKRYENYRKIGQEANYEGLNSRQRENEKINRMFGSKKALKEFQRNLTAQKKKGY